MSTAAAEVQNATSVQDDESNRPLPLRGDTILGVCEAIGQDFGFHPNWLRIPFAALILLNPTAVIAAYLALGCVVAVSRLMFPAKRRAAAPKLVSETSPTADRKDEELPIAA